MGRGGPNKGPLFDLENFRHSPYLQFAFSPKECKI